MYLQQMRYTAKGPSIFLAALAAAGGLGLFLLDGPDYAEIVPSARVQASVTAVAQDNAIRPFRINVSEEALANLHRRIAATRWPDKETVTDQSQGVQLAKIQELVGYWGTGYDWRKAEAKLNALPQFVTIIDGIDIQFVWVRSGHPNAGTARTLCYRDASGF
jgi:Epoxide hydrolase N terminus